MNTYSKLNKRVRVCNNKGIKTPFVIANNLRTIKSYESGFEVVKPNEQTLAQYDKILQVTETLIAMLESKQVKAEKIKDSNELDDNLLLRKAESVTRKNWLKAKYEADFKVRKLLLEKSVEKILDTVPVSQQSKFKSILTVMGSNFDGQDVTDSELESE